MSDSLVTYLNDHLGGAQVALQVLEAMRKQHADVRFRDLTDHLLPEIEADNQILLSLAEKVGAGPSAVKQAGGWLVEKMSRLKLGHTEATNFETFESLELLVLGIHGKLCLWKALAEASRLDFRLREYDFGSLLIRAQGQYNEVEGRRLLLAQTVLAP